MNPSRRERPWSVSFQFPQQVDDGFGFPREMSSKLLARTHRHEIVNGLPFIQLFSSCLTLVTVVQGRRSAHHEWCGGCWQTRCTRLHSASRKYTRTRQWKSLRAICLSIFPGDALTRRQSRGMELQTFPEGPSIWKKHKFGTPCVAMMQDEQWILVFYFNLNRILHWSFCDAF